MSCFLVRRRRKAFVFAKSCLFFFFHKSLFGSVSLWVCVVVVVGCVTSALVAVWLVFLCGFAFRGSFGCDFAVDVSLVTMAACCGSGVLVVDVCCFTSLFTS